jgi:hypothetical protein
MELLVSGSSAPTMLLAIPPASGSSSRRGSSSHKFDGLAVTPTVAYKQTVFLYLTNGILMGLTVFFLIAAIVIGGFYCLIDIQTPDRFETPRKEHNN